ncbi:hypothetical protein MHEL_55930 [Mycolicibacterium helvum]|uniref:Uncharacterized protein n=1 Tax=Mycolicibacterium helvum TaxID=1534349 RepID=A0A7I7TEC2_9MYCO|nr:hypothetical protein MHEL_55930 [Mycolicibacterium helvum]
MPNQATFAIDPDLQQQTTHGRAMPLTVNVRGVLEDRLEELGSPADGANDVTPEFGKRRLIPLHNPVARALQMQVHA